MTINRFSAVFLSLLLFHIVVLLFLTNEFSLSYKEVLIYYSSEIKSISSELPFDYEYKTGLLPILVDLSTNIFGQSDLAVRLPFILFYIGSAILLYKLTDGYFKSERDRLFSLAIFMILPGVNSAALLLNESIIVVFFTLLYLYLYKLNDKEYYILLVLFLFIDNSFAILFLALFFYSLKKKDNMLLAFSLVLFGISMSMYGFDVGGRPKGYFIDTFAIYATIFSPVLFLYFFYAVYRTGLKFEKDLFWYISITALGLSLIFSLRQKVAIEDFAPFVVIAIPLMVKLFTHSLRVRLREFRKPYYIMARVALTVLVLNFVVFVFNKYLYIFIDNPKKHFAYKYHIAKDLAAKLKELNIKSISTNDKELALRLKFYGIEYGKDYFITSSKVEAYDKVINIQYHNISIRDFYLVNL